jgi:hypothetical protein
MNESTQKKESLQALMKYNTTKEFDVSCNLQSKLKNLPMKKILLGLLMFQLFSFAANAQIQKGSILLGGAFNFQNNQTNFDTQYQPQSLTSKSTVNSNSFGFNPKIGYSLDNNWMVGTLLILNSSKSTSEATTVNDGDITNFTESRKGFTYGIGFFTRKYFPFNDHLAAFGAINTNISKQNNQVKSTNNSQGNIEVEGDYTALGSSLQAGLTYFPKNWLAIELYTDLIQFSRTSQKQDNDSQNSKTTNSGFSSGLNTASFYFGVSFFLNNK